MLGANTMPMCCAAAPSCAFCCAFRHGGGEHHVHAELAADVEVMQRAFGTGEIDQHVRALKRSCHIRTDLYSAKRAEHLSGILAEQRAAAMLQRGMQHQNHQTGTRSPAGCVPSDRCCRRWRF